MLASDQHAAVEEAMQLPLICNESLLWDKKQLAIFLSMAERPGAFQLSYAQQDLECSCNLLNIKLLHRGFPIQSTGCYRCANGC